MLDPINELADGSPGFMWRLQTEDGDATAIRALDDERILVNMSVWESIDALGQFVYASRHLEVMRRRRAWFEKMAESFLALWWTGTAPTIPEARAVWLASPSTGRPRTRSPFASRSHRRTPSSP